MFDPDHVREALLDVVRLKGGPHDHHVGSSALAATDRTGEQADVVELPSMWSRDRA